MKPGPAMLSLCLLACGPARSVEPEHGGRCGHGGESAAARGHGAAGGGHGHGHGQGAAGVAHHGDGHGGMVHDFSDVARFEQMFDAPDRDGWQHPVEVVALLDLAPGETAIDLGAGTGYFLPFLSVAVGATGHVLALDSEPAMIEHVQRRAEREVLANVEARAVTATDAGLAPASADAILIVDTWHHLPDRAAYGVRLRDALRPGGTLVVVDFTLESPEGPPAEHRLAPEVVIRELQAAGLAAEQVGESLPHQYAVRAIR
jgi:predicted methyltransferase